MTAAEVKTILGITVATYDTQIAAFIPYVARDIISYIGHAFQDGYVYRESGSELTFTPDTSTGDYITDSASEFYLNGFRSGMDIAVEGGFSNVGIYGMTSASTAKLLLDQKGILVAQEQGSTEDDHAIGTIRISRIKWPPEIKLTAAKMVGYLVDNGKVSDAVSERLDDYAITYAGSNAYPNAIIKSLEKFRKPVFG